MVISQLSRSPYVALRRRYLTLAVLVAITGCARQSSNAPHYGQLGKAYPASVVAALSVASASAAQADSPYQAAVNCAAAIRNTTAALAAANVSLGDAGQHAMEQAEEIFVGRAMKLQSATANRDVASRQDATRDQVGEEAQLSLACVRTLS